VSDRHGGNQVDRGGKPSFNANRMVCVCRAFWPRVTYTRGPLLDAERHRSWSSLLRDGGAEKTDNVIYQKKTHPMGSGQDTTPWRQVSGELWTFLGRCSKVGPAGPRTRPQSRHAIGEGECATTLAI